MERSRFAAAAQVIERAIVVGCVVLFGLASALLR